MELQSPPVIQIMAGCFLPSAGSGVTYAASSPTGLAYFTKLNSPLGGCSTDSLAKLLDVKADTNPFLDRDSDSELTCDGFFCEQPKNMAIKITNANLNLFTTSPFSSCFLSPTCETWLSKLAQ